MQESAPEPEKHHLSWGTVSNAVKELGYTLQKHNVVPKTIVGVARGGLIPSVMLSHYLGIADYRALRTIGYDAHDHIREVQTVNPVTGVELAVTEILSLNRSDVLVVDDIWDSGNTHRVLSYLMPKANFATLFHKPRPAAPHAHRVVNFPGLELPNKWIVFPWELEQVDQNR